MNVQAIGKIRDARGLTTNEKMFLYTVASHKNGMFKTHDKNYTDMGISKATYYRVRGELMDKELVVVMRRIDNSTVYQINDDALDDWLKSHTETSDSATQNGKSHTETPESHSETAESLSETVESHCAETKDNLKNNLKKNLQEEPNESAGASSFPQDQNETDKEGQDVVPAPPIGNNQPVPPASPIQATKKGESHCETIFNPRNLTDAQRRRLHWDDPLYLPPLPKPAPVETGLEW